MQRNIVRSFYFLLGFLSVQVAYTQDYDLKNPDKSYILPAELREVSDITVINNNTIACVQDEKGILFIYDLTTNAITRKDSFYLDGDYEGIAKVKNDLYVLRSDGFVIELKRGVKGKMKLQTHPGNSPAMNNEGLCYDASNQRLLIAAKSRSLGTVDNKDKRMIYAFDLQTKTTSKNPVFEMDILEIKKYLSKKYSLPDTVASAIKFKPSAIAIHPVNGKLYMLTATGYLLCVFDQGVFESAEMLDPLLFNKAEGISFFANGDLMISNEGQSGNANLLLFIYHQ